MLEIKSLTDRVFFGGRVKFEENNSVDSYFIPLATSCVSAGFPSPAEDYVETSINLNKELIRHPDATFFVRASGDSMIDAGIRPNATLVVDRVLETKPGDIIIARIGDELCVKELFISDEGRIFLMPKNENYQPFEVTEDLDFEIWGKVVCSINMH